MFKHYISWLGISTRSNRNRPYATAGMAILTTVAFTLASVGAKDASRPLQRQSSTSQSISPQAPTGSRKPLAEQRLAGGFWRVDHTFLPSLIITNFLQNAELPVTPVLYAADGTEYGLPPVTLGPGGVSSVDIVAALNSAPNEIKSHFSDHGSAGIKYLWHSAGAMSAMVQNRDAKRSLNFNFELHSPMAMQHSAAATVKEGLWWKEDPGVKGFLGLMNIAQHPVDVQVEVLSEQGAIEHENAIQLQPMETNVLDILEDTKATSGGIRVTYGGTEKDIILAGGLENPPEGYSAQIPFTVLQPGAKPSTVAVSSVGLMVGAPDPMMKFPSGTQFGVYAAFRNTSDRPILVKPVAYYMQGNQVQTATLHKFALGPRQARHWTGDQFLKEAGLATFSGILNLVFSYEGAPADILMANGSIDQTRTYVFESVMKAVEKSNAKGLKAWDVSNGNDTMISLLNLADTDQDLLVTFFFDGGRYKYPVHLQAGGSTTFNVSDIIMKQQPDTDGNTIPPGVAHGSAVLSGSLDFTESINVAASVGVFNVSTATCGTTCPTCFGYSAFQVLPYNSNSSTALVGSSTTFVGWGYGQDNYWHNVTYLTSWSSDNTNVATSQGGGSFNGVSGGTFNAIGNALLIDANADCPEGSHNPCPFSAYFDYSGGLVQVPAHLVRVAQPPCTSSTGIGPLVTGTNITVTNCSGNNIASNVCGGYQNLTYNVTDQQGNPIKNGTATLTEAFSNISPSQDPIPHTPGSVSLNLSTQVLSDLYSIYSSPACPTPNLSDSLDQTWTATVGSTVYNLTTVIHITRATNDGFPSFTSTITTP